MLELVHNNNVNKVEAVDRGALPALADALDRHAYTPHVQIHAARAVRSITFKMDGAKDAAAQNEGAVVRSVCTALRQSLDVLEYHHTGETPREMPPVAAAAPAAAADADDGAEGAGRAAATDAGVGSAAAAPSAAPALHNVDPVLALGLAEEAMATLTAVCNKHGECFCTASGRVEQENLAVVVGGAERQLGPHGISPHPLPPLHTLFHLQRTTLRPLSSTTACLRPHAPAHCCLPSPGRPRPRMHTRRHHVRMWARALPYFLQTRPKRRFSWRRFCRREGRCGRRALNSSL
jgi:nitrite reductase/ring-hydroxylating ferredoxin subunit